jgi:hypothetical protein
VTILVDGYELSDTDRCSEATRRNVRIVVEAAWVTVEVDEKDAGTISAQIPRAVFTELFRRVAVRGPVDSYLTALVEVGKIHGLSLSHEDGHGSFIVRPNNEYDDNILSGDDRHVLVDLEGDR